jgi:peptidoglycan/LPS O-acetylase OafA/YrhL
MALPRDSWWRTWHLGAYVALVAIIASMVAAVVYYRIEKPFIALGRRLARRLFERPGAVSRSVSGVA